MVEIRYARGVVYLDKCGSLMIALQDVLGEPFRAPGLADLRHADLVSDFERIVVRYGPHQMSYTQEGPETAARCEKVSADAWKTVSESLGVGRHVTRCGIRLQYTWPSDNVEDARSRLRSSGLVESNEQWSSIFGKPQWGAAIWFYEDKDRGQRTRIELDVIENKVQGELPASRVPFTPPAGVRLDVDKTCPQQRNEHFALGPGQLKQFIRSSWEDFKKLRKQVDRLLATEKG